MPDPHPICYGYNAFGLLRVESYAEPLGLLSPRSAGVGEAEVARPAEMMGMGDSLGGGLAFMRGDLNWYGRVGNAYSRHSGRANVLFCDEHVGPIPLPRLLEDTNDVALVRWNRDHQPHQERL